MSMPQHCLMNSALRLFLYDVLDVHPDAQKDLAEVSEIVSGTSVRFDVLFKSSSLKTNLAFHESWKTATFGSPSRIDYDAFVRRLPGKKPSAGSVWTETTHNALMGAFSVGTHLGVHPHHTKLLQAAVETYQRVLAAIGNAADAAASQTIRRLLVSKLEDRFGGRAIDASTNLVAIYASLVLSDPYLEQLEQWSRGTDENQHQRPQRPASVMEYYDRVAAAGQRLRLPFQSPLTKLVLHIEGAPTPRLACVELLRIPLSRDGHLWRRDGGGSLLILGRSNAVEKRLVCMSHNNGVEAPSFKFRVSRGIPSSLLYNALPLSVYSRVVVARSGEEDVSYAVRGPGELVHLLVGDGTPVGGTVGGTVRTVRLSTTRPQSSKEYWIPQGIDEVTQRAMILAHLQKPCALCAPQGLPNAGSIGGDLLLHRFVASYVMRRQLVTRVFDTPPGDEGGRTGELVLVDNRANMGSIWSILITLDNLRTKGNRWSVSVFCSDANVEFVRTHLLPRVPNARIVVLNEINGKFDLETYNDLLKSPAFWDRIRSPHALLVQDDGMIVRPGLDEDRELLAQAFVGAPWIDVPQNRAMLEEAGVGPELVGNGGLSLRNVQAMRDITTQDAADHGHVAFCGNQQPIPEDVFFAAALHRRGKLCPREAAERFAFEEKLPDKCTPLGFHKPWPYMPPAVVADYFDSLLMSLTPVNDTLI